YQGVTELGPIGDDGVRGVITASDAPGALLDNAGQLMGFWLMRHGTRDLLAFPSTIDELTFHGPHPPAGQRVACVVRVTRVTDTQLVADLELRTPDGRIWAHAKGWADRRFD